MRWYSLRNRQHWYHGMLYSRTLSNNNNMVITLFYYPDWVFLDILFYHIIWSTTYVRSKNQYILFWLHAFCYPPTMYYFSIFFAFNSDTIWAIGMAWQRYIQLSPTTPNQMKLPGMPEISIFWSSLCRTCLLLYLISPVVKGDVHHKLGIVYTL